MHIGLTLSLFCLQILRSPLSPKTELLTETPLPVSGSNTLYMEGKGWCWYLLSRGQGQTLPKIQDRGYPTPLPRKNHPTLNYACQVVKSSSRRYISPQHEATCRAHHCQVHASLATPAFCSWQQQDTCLYSSDALRTLGKGLGNFCSCILEYISQPSLSAWPIFESCYSQIRSGSLTYSLYFQREK